MECHRQGCDSFDHVSTWQMLIGSIRILSHRWRDIAMGMLRINDVPDVICSKVMGRSLFGVPIVMSMTFLLSIHMYCSAVC